MAAPVARAATAEPMAVLTAERMAVLTVVPTVRPMAGLVARAATAVPMAELTAVPMVELTAVLTVVPTEGPGLSDLHRLGRRHRPAFRCRRPAASGRGRHRRVRQHHLGPRAAADPRGGPGPVLRRPARCRCR